METDSTTAAKLAGLNISERTEPGITRIKLESSPNKEGPQPVIAFEYKLPNGEQVVDEERILNLNSLAVPPAWTDVWFCVDDRGHIQATGKDARGRLQYRYHPDWNAIKADLKFANVDEFAMMLPRLRDRVEADLTLTGMPLVKSIALVIRLMDIYHIRVGSDEYAKQNDSYGLTTLKEGHVKFVKGEPAEGKIDAILKFTGKSGKQWRLLIEDDDLASMIETSGKVGGRNKSQDLFRYVDVYGNDYDVKAEHINNYIEEALDVRYTAKAFRTWSASWKTGARLALVATASENLIANIPKLTKKELARVEGMEEEPIIIWRNTQLKRPEALAKLAKAGKLQGHLESERLATMLAVIDTVAADLGNTRTVCRTSYIRPMFLDDWMSGKFENRWQDASTLKRVPGLNREESTAVHYMRTHE
jgi:DNA topoisomerase-1